MRVMVDPALPRHPKIIQLAAELGVGRASAVGYVVSLWCFGMDAGGTGRLPRCSPVVIASASGWTRVASRFVDSLISAGFLDFDGQTYSIHDWLARQGDIPAMRAADRVRKAEHSVWIPAGIQTESTPPFPPLPIPTLPSPPHPSETPLAASRPPTPREMGDDPHDMTVHALMQIAERAKCPSSPAQIRAYVEALTARADVGASKLESYLASRDARGQTVFAWEAHFKPNGKPHGPKPPPETFKKLY